MTKRIGPARHSVAREVGLWFSAVVVGCTFGATLGLCYLIGLS